MIYTPYGSFTYEELAERDKIVKQMFFDFWDGKMDVFELVKKQDEMLKNNKISYAELKNLQYEASREHDKLHEK